MTKNILPFFLSVSLCLCSTNILHAQVGVITTVVGHLPPKPYSGDGGPATSAQLNNPWSTAEDGLGNIYIADAANNVIRMVNTAGIITTVAGNNNLGAGYNGDGIAATAAQLNNPTGIAVDGSGNIYIADENNQVIREVSGGIISTIAGTPDSNSYSGDGGPATSAILSNPVGVAVDGSGNIYIADAGNQIIREITGGIINTIAGIPDSSGGGGDGGPATAAKLTGPASIAIDGAGNIYIADQYNQLIRKVSSSGIITTVAGNIVNIGYRGDGGLATSVPVRLHGPHGVAKDASGNIYIADATNNVIREVNTAGIISTIAGNDQYGAGDAGDGGSATHATLNNPVDVAVDASGNIYIADQNNNTIRKVSGGIITTIAGTPTVAGYSGDGGPATAAQLDKPMGVALDGSGNIYIADYLNNLVRKIDTSGIINTVAGVFALGHGYTGDGSPATSVPVGLDDPVGVAEDIYGNIYIADAVNSVIREVSTSGIISTVAGNQTMGGFFGGDGGAATAASLKAPGDVVVDAFGNLYIADAGNDVIREVNTAGIINTIAGTPSTGGYGGDGGLANAAQLNYPSGLALDTSGNMYIADYGNSVIRKINTAGIITTVAGNGGRPGYSGDGTNATAVPVLLNPTRVAEDIYGNLYIIDADDNVVREVNTAGIIATVAGNENLPHGYSGDGGPATAAQMHFPAGAAVDDSGNIYIADQFNHVIRKVNTAGIITTVAGNQAAGNGYSGDGGPATAGQLNYPAGVTVDTLGNLYIADANNNVIREVNTAGIISTVAGDHAAGSGYSGNGGPATAVPVQLNAPYSVAEDVYGNLYIADVNNNVVRKVSTSGIITTVAGSYALGGGYNGDNIAATAAQLSGPSGLAVDSSDNLYIADNGNNIIRKVDTAGIITTVAGTPGSMGYAGDGGPATASGAYLHAPVDVAVDDSGNIYISDNGNNVIREVNATGIITTIAGNNNAGAGYSGDGGSATAVPAQVNNPSGVAEDSYGNIYIVDQNNNMIREVNTDGIISTFAGNGIAGYAGDGVLATAAQLNSPTGVAVDYLGNVYIADGGNNVIREVSGGTISTFAGNGTAGYIGDGGYSTDAELNLPVGVAVDGSGNIYISDANNDIIREVVQSSGNIYTIAGTPLRTGYNDGDAYTAHLNNPQGIAVDGSGNVYFADLGNNVVREISSGYITTVAGNQRLGGSYSGDGEAATDAALNSPLSVSVDNSGNIYIADQGNQVIREVSGGIINTVAGIPLNAGYYGFANGRPATNALLNYPSGVFADGFGNFFIADEDNQLVEEVSSSGIITTIAGDNAAGPGYSGDGELANTVAAQLNSPAGLAVDGSGNIFIADASNYVVREVVRSTGIITTVAGNYSLGGNYSGDGGPATAATLNPNDIAVDGSGNLYIADANNDIVREVNTAGIINAVAGTPGSYGYSGDGVAATTAQLNYPTGIFADASGSIYIADQNNNVIREVNSSGIISTVAGVHSAGAGYGGDGEPATNPAATLNSPQGIAIDGSGNLYIADVNNNAIREVVRSSGIITTVAGNGSFGYSGDGGQATAGQLFNPVSVSVDGLGNIYIADEYNNVIREVSGGIINTFAGYYGGPGGYTGDGGPATAATLSPGGVAVDISGNVYIAEGSNNVVREVVSSTGIINTIAGNYALSGDAGDGEPATTNAYATLSYPIGVAVDEAGNLYIADINNQVIREVVSSTGIITTIAGNNSLGAGYNADGIAATAAMLNYPHGVAVDGSGNIYISDVGNQVIREVSGGIINTFAGTVGAEAYGGDGGPATAGQLANPTGIIVDALGNLYIADESNDLIREVLGNTDIITTIAGCPGTGGYAGDGEPATAGPARLNGPAGVAVDASGNLYIADYNNNVIREVNTAGILTTVAGNFDSGKTYVGDGGPATMAGLYYPMEVSVDASGNLYIADNGNAVIREVSGGTINTIAGTPTITGYSGDGGPATASYLNAPTGVTVDDSGNVYIADFTNNVIREINTAGIISTIAGDILARGGYAGDGEPAADTFFAKLYDPAAVAVDASGNLYIADSVNSVIREVNTAGIITTFAGNYNLGTGYSGDGGPATAAQIGNTTGVSVDGLGNVYITDNVNNVIRMVNTGGIITTVAGDYLRSYGGDGGPATAAITNNPNGVATDIYGNLYFADKGNEIIRKVSTDGIITTYAGNYSLGGNYSGDGGPATAAAINSPNGVAMDASGNLYIADGVNEVIRMVNTAGIITTVVGTPLSAGYSGDGAAATAAQLNNPSGVAVDASGNLYITDLGNNVIREVSGGIITTIAGNDTAGYSGDGGPATAAELSQPRDIAVDASGNVYIADLLNLVVRKISTSGIITTIAGNGTPGYSGDGGPATAAQLYIVGSVAVDNLGDVYITDPFNQVVRAVNSVGLISTIAGDYALGAGYTGDNGPATLAQLNIPDFIALDASGNIYFSDNNNNVIRKVNGPLSLCPTPTVSFDAASSPGACGGNDGYLSIGGLTPDYTFVLYYTDNGAQQYRTITADSLGNDTLAALSASDTITGIYFQTNLGCYTDTLAGPYSVGAGSITGTTAICVWATGVLSGVSSGGTWSSVNNAVATIDASGNITGVAPGLDTITYSCGSNNLYTVLTVNPLPSLSISGNLLIDSILTLSSSLAADSIIWENTGGRLQTNNAGWQANAVTVAGQSDTTSGIGANQLNGAIAVRLDDNGNLYVCDYNNNRVQKWAPGATSGTTVAGTGIAGNAANQLNGPYGVYVDVSGNIYVADFFNSRVQKWAPGADSGITVAGQRDGTPGIGADQLNLASGVYVDVSGNIYVADLGNNRVQKWALGATGGITVAGQSNGALGVGANRFNEPVDVNVDDSGNVYVADFDNNRVQKWAPGATGGITVAGQSDGTPGSDASHLHGASSVYVDGSGNVYVADYFNNRIQEWTPGVTGGITVAGQSDGTAGIGANQLYAASYVALDDSGNMYVADYSNNRVQKFFDTIVNTYVPTVTGNYTAVVTTFNGCLGIDSFTINAFPVVPAITGIDSVCAGNSVTLSDTAGGGIWSSANNTVATVNSAGVVTGVGAGVDTIVYAVTNAGGTTTVFTLVTVNPLPNAGIISGSITVCALSSDTLSSNGDTGTWSASNGNATISGTGVVSGITAGSDTITYTVIDGCGTAIDTVMFTVNPLPNAGSISGSTTVCALSSDTLSSNGDTGTWSASNGNATISSTGVVSGITTGSDTITYTVIDGCGTAIDTVMFTVNPLPNAGTISGSTTVCALSSDTLSSNGDAGTWSASNGNAAISSSGVVSGITAGSDTITYTVTNSCGTTQATMPVTVDTVADSISGVSNVCAGGSSVLFTDATVGGTWSTADGNASVDGSGNVTGESTGSDTIIYTVSNSCGTTRATAPLTVDEPAVGISGGSGDICIGNSTLFTDGTPGGSWSTAYSYVSIDGSGEATGEAPGNDNIIYSVTNSCGFTQSTQPIEVDAPAVLISGVSNICAGGAPVSFYESTPGGSWGVTNGNASVDGSGNVTGISQGNDVITFSVTNSCGYSQATAPVTIDAPAAPVSGVSNVCAGAAATLFTDATVDGTWSASNDNATVDGSGNVTGVSQGVDTISYSVTNSCGATNTTIPITVNPLPDAGNISGATTVCALSSDTLSSSGDTGGTWNTTNGNAAINSIGIVKGVSAGGDSITYTVINGCGTAIDTLILTVNPLPNAGTISGAATVCVLSSDTLSSNGDAGAWITSNSIATISSVGVVSGITAGSDTITYVVTNSCGTAIDSVLFTVNPLPNAGSISGTKNICASSSDTLTSSGDAGVWAAGNGNATVNIAGIVTGVSAGLDSITYTVTNGCGTAIDTVLFTVRPLPEAGSISGTTAVCIGSVSTLSDAASGGIWSSNNIRVTNINSAGLVNSVSVGIDTIIYSVTNSCGTATTYTVVTVNALPSVSISGNLCANSADTLNSTISLDSIVWANTGSIVQTNTLARNLNAVTVAGQSDGASGSGASQLNTSLGVYVDGSGNIYVADQGNNRVQEWAPGATSATTVAGNGTAGTGASQLILPEGVYVDGSGNIYVADGSNNRVQEWTPGATGGTTVAGQSDGTGGTGADQLSVPTAVYVDRSGNIYVTDYNNSRIQKWAPGADSGITVAGQSDGTGGVDASQLYYPYGAVVDGSGNIFVADLLNNRIQEWAPGATSGTTVAGTGIAGNSPSQLYYPAGLYVDGSGNIYVADLLNNRIQKWAPGATSGNTVAGSGIAGTGASQLNGPGAVYVDGSGDIYVTDQGNNRVQEFKETIVNAYTPTTGGSYTAVATSLAGCSTTDSFMVNTAPVVSAITGSTAGICVGSSTTFIDTATSGIWSATNSNATVNTAGVVIGVSGGIDTIIYSETNTCGFADTSQPITISTGDPWTGTTSTDWNTPTNWGCGIVPTASLPAVIPSDVINMPVISSGTFTVDSFSVASGDTVSIDGSANLNVTGTVVNLGVVTGTGTLSLTGTAAQLLVGAGSVSNLVISNSAGVSVNSGDTTYITGMLTMDAGTLTTHGGLTLVSNASGTASIGEITGGTISGNVNCQKYIAVPGTDTNRRAFRFWANPFSASIPLSQIEKCIDITGSGGSINGFTTTASNNPSCEWYNPVIGNSSSTSDPGWTWFTSTNGIGSNAFKPKEGINLFIRGKKGEGLNGLPYTPSPLTITMSGPVNQGTINDTMRMGPHSSYNQLGNPYASPVDIGTVIYNAKNATKITGSAFYVWNPYLAVGGAFEAKTISSTPYYLEAYCSFQVRTSASGNVLTFNESNKSTIDSESLLREEDRFVSLFIYDGSYNIWDKFYLSFNEQATDALDDYDAGKPVNIDLNFYSRSSDNEKLNIDARPYSDNKIIPLGITTDYQQQYILRVENVAMPASGQLYLHDKYLKKYERLEQGTEYRFNIISDPASQGDNRFELGLGNIPNDVQGNVSELSMLVRPNPASQNAVVSFITPGAENTNIRVLDVSGAAIMNIDLSARQKGTTSLTLDNLASGVYMIELTYGDKKITQRLIKE